MEQLSGLDALFVHAEMHGLPMHISTLSVYDPVTSPSGEVQFGDIINLFELRIKNQIAILRSRLVQVPFNFDQPYWEEDPNFDMVYHVRHIALPKPGNWHKLCSLVANLHAQPLNRKRPLWEAYIIDGLETIKGFPPGSFAVMLKVHHSVMDARTGTAIFNSLHTTHPDPRAAVDTFNFDDYPTLELTHNLTTSQIIRRAYFNNIKRTGSLIKIIAKSAATYADVKLAFRNKDVKSLHKPKTRFNGPISPRRIVDRINLPIDEVMAIKSVFKGETFNDVALTIIGGALRQYLLNKEELPESSLVAGIPIDVRRDEDKDIKGNLINVMNIALRTDIANPLERLHLLHTESKSGKTFAHLLGDHSIHEFLDSVYAGLISWGIRSAVDSGLMERFPPANNTIVASVPGTRQPVYLAGAKLVESFGMGPLIPNTGLFHTVSTTYDHMTISFTACRQMMDDPDYYVSCLKQSYQELLLAVSEATLASKSSVMPLSTSANSHLSSGMLEH